MKNVPCSPVFLFPGTANTGSSAASSFAISRHPNPHHFSFPATNSPAFDVESDRMVEETVVDGRCWHVAIKHPYPILAKAFIAGHNQAIPSYRRTSRRMKRLASSWGRAFGSQSIAEPTNVTHCEPEHLSSFRLSELLLENLADDMHPPPFVLAHERNTLSDYPTRLMRVSSLSRTFPLWGKRTLSFWNYTLRDIVERTI